jgi:hypothetical protein
VGPRAASPPLRRQHGRDAVERVLGGVEPHLMVTDPPYGVNYDAGWRSQRGVSRPGKALGKVLNDDNADWREAWTLFPGDVAYVWHAGLHAGEVESSLLAVGFTIRCQIIWDHRESSGTQKRPLRSSNGVSGP